MKIMKRILSAVLSLICVLPMTLVSFAAGSGSDAFPTGKVIVIVVVSLLVALIACSVMKGSMKSAHIKTEARSYVARDGVQMLRTLDRYTHTTETRTKVQDSQNNEKKPR